MAPWLQAVGWATATVAAGGLTAWLGWLFLSNPTITLNAPPPAFNVTCHSLAAVAAGKDNGDDAYDAGYGYSPGTTTQTINTACDERRIGKLTLVGLIVAPTAAIDVALGAAVRRRRRQSYP